MHTEHKLQIYLAETKDTLKSVGIIVGILLTLTDELLSHMVFDEELILKYVIAARHGRIELYIRDVLKE